jgi:beta-fructofuranosidase
LERWEYLGILFKHPDPKVVNIECPNFFELDGKWVLIVSPHRRVEYFVGTFDGQKFTPEKSGLLDHSDNFYAPNCTTDEKGRRILWGWIRGFKGGQGWNGALTFPRVLNVDEDGTLRQWPADELASLRDIELFAIRAKLNPRKSYATEIPVPRLEISAEFTAGDKSGMRIFKTAKNPGFDIYYDNGQLTVGGKTMPLALRVNDSLRLYVLVDHSVIEVNANSSVCYTSVYYPPSYAGEVEFFTRDERTHLNASIDPLESTWTGAAAWKGPGK